MPPDAAGVTPLVAWFDAGGAPGRPAGSYLCLVTWDNPEPANPIHALDFTLGSGRSRALLVAMSVE
ncbi:MAG: hypothetical protein ACKOEQ_10445 [Verrucomicrobiota bacterium]